MKQELTTEEKINYIYNNLKKDEKKKLIAGFLKWGTRSLIPIFFGYMYFFGMQLISDTISSTVEKTLEKSKNNLIKSKDTIINGTVDKVKNMYENFDY